MNIPGRFAFVLFLALFILSGGCGGGGGGHGSSPTAAPAHADTDGGAPGETDGGDPEGTDTSRILAASLPLCKAGAAYESNSASHAPAKVQVKDGSTAYSFSLSSGSLPAGLNLDASGVVSGSTGASPSEYPFIMKVTDGKNPSNIFTQEMSIRVSRPGSGQQPYTTIAQDPRAYYVHQDASMCGPTAFYIILKYFGHDKPGAGPTNADLEETIPREGVPVVGTSSKVSAYFNSLTADSSTGTNWSGLENAASTLRKGYKALYPCIQSNAEEIGSDEAGSAQLARIFESDLVPFLETNSPVIIHLKRRYADIGVSGHYLVVIGYDRASDQVLYLDPNDSDFDPRDEGYDPDALNWSAVVRSIPRDTFINEYWYQKPWYPDARWDGKWLGFTR